MKEIIKGVLFLVGVGLFIKAGLWYYDTSEGFKHQKPLCYLHKSETFECSQHPDVPDNFINTIGVQ